MYHNRRNWYYGYCLSSQAETKHVSGIRSVWILRRKREGEPNLVVPLETTSTVTVLWQGLAVSNGTIRVVSSSALSTWIHCQKSIIHICRRMLFIEGIELCICGWIFFLFLVKISLAESVDRWEKQIITDFQATDFVIGRNIIISGVKGCISKNYVDCLKERYLFYRGRFLWFIQEN